MNSGTFILILQAVAKLLQQTGLTSTAIQNGIALLTGLVPVLIKEYRDVLPYVQNIISVLRSGDDITQEQLDELDQLEATLDAEWDAAVDEYEKQHPSEDK